MRKKESSYFKTKTELDVVRTSFGKLLVRLFFLAYCSPNYLGKNATHIGEMCQGGKCRPGKFCVRICFVV